MTTPRPDSAEYWRQVAQELGLQLFTSRNALEAIRQECRLHAEGPHNKTGNMLSIGMWATRALENAPEGDMGPRSDPDDLQPHPEATEASGRRLDPATTDCGDWSGAHLRAHGLLSQRSGDAE
jgi:hypothetical protein